MQCHAIQVLVGSEKVNSFVSSYSNYISIDRVVRVVPSILIRHAHRKSEFLGHLIREIDALDGVCPRM